jgi:hypothetical protein
VEYSARDPRNLKLGDVIEKILGATWRATPAKGFAGEVQRAVNIVALYHLMSLASNENAAPQARAIAGHKLNQLKTSHADGGIAPGADDVCAGADQEV